MTAPYSGKGGPSAEVLPVAIPAAVRHTSNGHRVSIAQVLTKQGPRLSALGKRGRASYLGAVNSQETSLASIAPTGQQAQVRR